MKKIYSILLLFTLFVGCKEEEKVKIGNSESFTAPVIISSPTTDTVAVLLKENEDNVLDTITWSAADFGVSSQINYSIIAKVDGYDGVSVVSSVTGSVTSIPVTVKEMNTAILSVTKFVSEAQIDTLDVKLHILASLSDESVIDANAVSPEAPFRAYPYYTPLLPENKIWVRGNHQGWTEDDNTTILGSTEKTGGPYTGYMWLDGDFKLCTGPTWSVEPNFGKNGDWTAAGNKENIGLDSDGGASNIPQPTTGAGMYFLNTDMSSTLEVENLTFQVTGSAVSTPVTMEWDPTQRVLFANVDFAEGTYTFKANDGHNLGMGTSSGLAVHDGEAIAVTAGTKMVVLDLKIPGNLTYHYAGVVEKVAPVITAPATGTTFVLDESAPTTVVTTFTWDAATETDATVTGYALKSSGNSIPLTDPTATTFDVTNELFNAAALSQGGTPGTAADYQFVVEATMSSGSVLTSDPITLNLTPYAAFGPQFYMYGSMQGWNENDGSYILSPADASDLNGKYYGLYSLATDNEFKLFPTLGSWDNGVGFPELTGHYGEIVEADPGNNPNIKYTGSERKLHFEYDNSGVVTKVLNVRKYGLFKVGSANGWNDPNNADWAEVELTETGDGTDIYTIQLDLVQGEEFKFVTVLTVWDNMPNAVNYGAGLGVDGTDLLDTNGNIQVGAASGNYTLTVNLNDGSTSVSISQ